MSAIAKIVAGLAAALEAIGQKPRLLPSGAGHDTMIMGQLCPAGMLFVRCKGGVSHNPLESITTEDCEIALGRADALRQGFSRGVGGSASVLQRRPGEIGRAQSTAHRPNNLQRRIVVADAAGVAGRIETVDLIEHVGGNPRG